MENLSAKNWCTEYLSYVANDIVIIAKKEKRATRKSKDLNKELKLKNISENPGKPNYIHTYNKRLVS